MMPAVNGIIAPWRFPHCRVLSRLQGV